MNSRYWSPHLIFIHKTSYGYAICEKLSSGQFAFQLNKSGIDLWERTWMTFHCPECGVIDPGTYGPYQSKNTAVKRARELYPALSTRENRLSTRGTGLSTRGTALSIRENRLSTRETYL